MAFLVDITGHLNDLNLKLQGKNKLFPDLVNDINAFKMKIKLFISQLEIQDLRQFPRLKEQSECTATIGNLGQCVEKIKLLQESFENRFRDFVKEESYIPAFLNTFSLSEQDGVVLRHTLPVFTGLGRCPIVNWDFAGAVSIFGPDALPVVHQ